eukprot:39004_1
MSRFGHVRVMGLANRAPSQWSCFCVFVLCVFSLQILFMHWINVLAIDINYPIKNQHHLLVSNSNGTSIKLLQINNLEIKLPHRFYQIEDNPKYFTEFEGHPHVDKQYGIEDLSMDDIHNTLRHLYLEFKNTFLPSHWQNLSNISKNACYWLEYGTLMGAYRDQDIIPWDDDGDMGIFDHCLYELPLIYESMDWVFKRNPSQNSYIYDSHNTVSARFISKRNGVFIDFYSYSTVNGYVYNSWSVNNFDYWQPLDDLLPLNHSGVFLLNHTFNIPRNTKKWLLNEYGTLEVPYDHRVYDDNYTFYGFYNVQDDYYYPF